MGAARETDQADFDLERFIEMFDEALTSQDPRVMRTLRDLMMIVALTRPESRSGTAQDRQHGPLRRLFEDINHLNQRLYRAEEELRDLQREKRTAKANWEKPYEYDDRYTMAAAAKMAQSIDVDAMKNIARQINSPGLNLVQPKGLLKK